MKSTVGKGKGGRTRTLEKRLCYDGEVLTDLIRAYISVSNGVVQEFSIMYNTIIDGKEHTVVRYDCSHGFAHKDELFGEKKEKIPMPNLDLNKLVDIALDEIQRDWQAQKNQYMRNHRRGGK